MNVPKDLQYSKSHEWVRRLEDGAVLVGITDYAQSTLGDMVFITLPEVGERVEMDAPFCDVESVKAVSDVVSPVSGVIAAVNEALPDEPERLNSAPYEAWIARVEQLSETVELLDAAAYEAFCAERREA